MNDNVNVWGVRRSITFLAGVNIVAYSLVLSFFPHFLGDDYTLFALVKSAPSIPVSIHPEDPFFLFTRPVSYALYWILYLLCETNALWMKGIIFAIHIGLVSLFYLFLLRANEYFELGADTAMLLLISLFLSLHPDAIMWVDWISNTNELIMVLLYVSGLYSFLRYLMDRDASYRWLLFSVLFFLLSTLAKQQSIHFPLLMIFAMVMLRSRIHPEKRRNLKIAILISLLTVAAQIAINYFVNIREYDIIDASYLVKKPFAIAGTILYMLFPAFGNELYHWFLIHKLYALIAGSVVAAIVLFSVRKKRGRGMALMLLFIVVIFFPRMLGPGGERINAVQLLWLCLAMAASGRLIENRKAVYGILAVIVILALAGSFKIVQRQINAERSVSALTDRVNALQAKVQRPVYFLYSSVLLSWPHQFYFQQHRDFGTTDKILFSGVVARPLQYDFALPDRIHCKRVNTSFSITTATPLEYFLDMNSRNRQMILVQTKSSPIKGFQRIDFLIPEEIRKRDPLYVSSHDGEIIPMQSVIE